MPKSIYILKTQGTGKIPDYIQLRDSNFVHLLHARADKIIQSLDTIELQNYADTIEQVVANLTYGEMTLIDL